MLKKGIFILSIFSFSVTLTCFSQEMMTLNDLRKLAIENSKHLKIASEEEKVAYYEKKEAFLKYFPKFSAKGAYLHNQKDLYLIGSSSIPTSIHLPTTGLDIPIPNELRDKIKDIGKLDISNIYVGSIMLTQPLFMGGRIVAYNDIRENAKELAKSKKDMQLQEVISELDATYWQVVSLAEKKKLAQSYCDLLKKMSSDVNTMHQEGVATKADVLTVNVKVNEAEVSLTKVENGLSLSRMLLNQLCGLELETEYILADENTEMKEFASNLAEIPNVDEALQNRAEIRSLEYAVKIYKGKEKIARAEFLPEVGLTAGYLVTNPSSFDGLKDKFGGMFNIGVVVNVPLNFLSSSAKVNAAKAETRIQEYHLEEAREKIGLQVNQFSFKLTEASKKHIATSKNLEKAQENLDYAKVGFQEGVIPASDVLAAHTAWLSAHSELIDSQIDIKLCNLYLNKALGRNLNDIKK